MGKDQIHSLIKKLLKGTITKEEFNSLNNWYDENLDSKEIKILSPYSKDEIHNRLKSRINQRIKPKRNFPIKIYLPIAASLLIVASILLNDISYNDKNKTKELISEYNYITFSGERNEIILPDNSKIKLNSNSSLQFIQKINTREVNLTGEAFFDVQRNEKLPFHINTQFGRVIVLGTSFNVDLHDSVFNVFVKSGKVSVLINDIEEILTKNDFLKYNPITNNISLEKGKSYDIDWIDNKLIFDGINLSKALRKFERWYGVEFEIQKEINLNKKINASFNDVSLKEAIKSLEFILDSEIINKNNKLILK